MNLDPKYESIRKYAAHLDETNEEQAQIKVRLLDLLDRSRQLDAEIEAILARQSVDGG